MEREITWSGSKCSIVTDAGECLGTPTKYIYGIELCDNHYHILYHMNDNVVTKSQMAEILEKKIKEGK